MSNHLEEKKWKSWNFHKFSFSRASKNIISTYVKYCVRVRWVHLIFQHVLFAYKGNSCWWSLIVYQKISSSRRSSIVCPLFIFFSAFFIAGHFKLLHKNVNLNPDKLFSIQLLYLHIFFIFFFIVFQLIIMKLIADLSCLSFFLIFYFDEFWDEQVYLSFLSFFLNLFNLSNYCCSLCKGSCFCSSKRVYFHCWCKPILC